MDHISCNYKKRQIRNNNQEKEELIKIFSKIKGKNEVSSQQLVDEEKNHNFIRDVETLKVNLFKELKERFV